MSRARARLALATGLVVLAVAWAGPLPGLVAHAFTAHMVMHVAVVALAAPLVAIGLAHTGWDPVPRWPRLFSAIPASAVELVVVWAWHAPALHHASRTQTPALVLEQASFLITALLVWLSAFGDPSRRRERVGAGVIGLLLTSMHMTLLGALLALAGRTLYHHTTGWGGFGPLQDQEIGGAIMLLGGGACYLAGALALLAGALRAPAPPLVRARGEA